MLIVGAGIAGLSAALEAARAGAKVAIVELSSVAGGHAILSNGAVSLVGTPLQQSRNVSDSSALAYRDLMERGKDADSYWA